MTSEDQKLMLLEFSGALLKSWWTIVAGVCIGLTLAIVGLQFTRNTYEARAAITADVEKLPREFIRRTISDDLELQLNTLRNAVLSEDNLRQLVIEYFGTPTSEESERALMRAVASRVNLNFDTRERVIGIHYRDFVPVRAANVANMLAELFVLENQKLRADTARQVRESLESLTADVDAELERETAALNRLLAEHPFELDSQRFSNEQTILTLQEELKENQTAIISARQRFEVLGAQRSQREAESRAGTTANSEAAPGATEDPRIVELEEEIETLLRRLTENHPDVVAKRREIDRIRAAGEGSGTTPAENTPADEAGGAPPAVPGLDIWEIRIRAAELEVDRLEKKDREIRSQIARHRSYLASTPIIQQQVDDLTARIQVLRQKAIEDGQKIETAKSGEQLEEEDIGNPFVITSFAAPPSIPVSPNRMTFLGGGVAGGLVLFVAPLLAGTFLRPKIMTEQSLSSLAELPLLATIPSIETPEIRQSRRRNRGKNVGLAFVSASTLVAVVALKIFDVL